MQDDETHSHRDKVKNNKKGRKSFASGADSARLAVKVVFSDPALFDLGDAAFKNPWDVLCGLLLKVFGGSGWFSPHQSSRCANPNLQLLWARFNLRFMNVPLRSGAPRC